jgi:hypothetical protein
MVTSVSPKERFPVSQQRQLVADWVIFSRSGFRFEAYTPRLHQFLMAMGFKYGPHPSRDTRAAVWYAYFAENLFQTTDLLVAIMDASPDELGLFGAKLDTAQVGGYPLEPAIGRAILTAIRQDLVKIYDDLTRCIETIIDDQDEVLKRAEQQAWAEDLHQTEYPQLSIDEIIETMLPALHWMPSCYEDDLPIEINETMRQALSQAVGETDEPPPLPLRQPALFGLRPSQPVSDGLPAPPPPLRLRQASNQPAASRQRIAPAQPLRGTHDDHPQ